MGMGTHFGPPIAVTGAKVGWHARLIDEINRRARTGRTHANAERSRESTPRLPCENRSFRASAPMRAFAAAARWLEDFPDTPGFCDHHLRQGWKQFALLLLTGLFFRAVTFGDPNLHVDEAFYFLVGQEMHHGAIPYVDIWDRKPLGLFLIYYLIAGISTSVFAYQIIAWLFASSTAMVINRIAQRWAGTQGGLLAGICYLAMLGPLEGYGGQTPVFYNLFMACAVLLALDAQPQLEEGHPTWRTFASMALGGLAITVKQTALFECAFVGLFVAFCMVRSSAPAWWTGVTILTCAITGALPTLTIAATYFWMSDWQDWWQAMVTSNLAKVHPTTLNLLFNALMMILCLYPLIALTLIGVSLGGRNTMGKKYFTFVSLWMFSAILGMISVPNFYTHYALPLTVPLAVSSSLILDRRDVGCFLATVLTIFTIILFNPFDRVDRERSIQSMDRMSQAIKQHDSGGGLLVYDAPPYLYALSHKHSLTPLTFPNHMNEWIEKDVSRLDTLKEVRRIIQAKPGVVAMAAFPSNLPVNYQTRRIVEAYVYNNCRIVDVDESREINSSSLIAIWGDCQEGAPDLEVPDE
jgi:hypothetical protein